MMNQTQIRDETIMVPVDFAEGSNNFENQVSVYRELSRQSGVNICVYNVLPSLTDKSAEYSEDEIRLFYQEMEPIIGRFSRMGIDFPPSMISIKILCEAKYVVNALEKLCEEGKLYKKNNEDYLKGVSMEEDKFLYSSIEGRKDYGLLGKLIDKILS